MYALYFYSGESRSVSANLTPLLTLTDCCYILFPNWKRTLFFYWLNLTDWMTMPDWNIQTESDWLILINWNWPTESGVVDVCSKQTEWQWQKETNWQTETDWLSDDNCLKMTDWKLSRRPQVKTEWMTVTDSNQHSKTDRNWLAEHFLWIQIDWEPSCTPLVLFLLNLKLHIFTIDWQARKPVETLLTPSVFILDILFIFYCVISTTSK